MATDEEKREYVSNLRRGLKAVARGLDEIDPAKRRVLILDGFARVLQAHERFSCATTGTAEILKPLILVASDDPDTSGGLLWSLIRAIEGTYHIQPSTQDWRVGR